MMGYFKSGKMDNIYETIQLTSSFRKLLSATEDAKNMSKINRIVRKALGEDETESLITKYDTVKLKSNNDSKKSCEVNNNENKWGTHIYETIPLKAPPQNETKWVKYKKMDNVCSLRSKKYQKQCIAPKKIFGTRAQKFRAMYSDLPTLQTTDLPKEITRNCLVEIPADKPVTPIDARYETLKFNKPKDTAEHLRQMFLDENGQPLSPITKLPPRPKEEKRINIQISDSPQTGDKNANNVAEISDTSVTPDKPLGVFERNRSNRIVSSTVMDVFELLQGSNNILDDLSEIEKNTGSDSAYSSNADIKSISSSEAEPLYAIPIKTPKTASVEDMNDDDAFFKLKQQADIQCKVMRQASKALAICKSLPNGSHSQLVEAERILLTAGCKHARILQEIRQGHYENPVKISNAGSVEISDIRIGLTQRKEVEWFVCVLSDEKNVFCTQALQVQPDSQIINFNEMFVFDNLDAAFQIKVDVYSMKVKKRSESKYGLNKRVSTLCTKSRRLLYKDVQTNSLIESTIPTSSFTLHGSQKINIDNLTMPADWHIETYPGAPLTGYIDMNAKINSVRVAASQAGFLTIGTETDVGMLWNRRWCILDETILKQWNYPNEEGIKDPVNVLNLNACRQEITKATRSCCPKPKTLLLETVDDERHFLNADSVAEMYEWRNKLNKVYNALRGWRMLDKQQGTDV